MLEDLRENVLQANLELVRRGLVTLTFGNVSGIDRASGLMAIKPSGVSYEGLTAEDIVLVDPGGRTVESRLQPSSDTPTHRALYEAFPEIGGIAHAHSVEATAFAQARLEIPCLGTTHADHFNGPVPLTRFLSPKEVEAGYEANTGAVIVDRFAGLRPLDTEQDVTCTNSIATALQQLDQMHAEFRFHDTGGLPFTQGKGGTFKFLDKLSPADEPEISAELRAAGIL